MQVDLLQKARSENEDSDYNSFDSTGSNASRPRYLASRLENILHFEVACKTTQDVVDTAAALSELLGDPIKMFNGLHPKAVASPAISPASNGPFATVFQKPGVEEEEEEDGDETTVICRSVFPLTFLFVCVHDLQVSNEPSAVAVQISTSCTCERNTDSAQTIWCGKICLAMRCVVQL